MNFKYSGLFFVLIVLVAAINGSAINSAPTGKSHVEETSTSVHLEPKKSQTEIAPTESKDDMTDSKIKNTTASISITTAAPSQSPLTASTTAAPTSTPAATTVAPTITTTTRTKPIPTSPVISLTPEKGTWIIRNNETKTTCIIAEMAMQLNITYPGNKKVENAVLNVPKNSSATGNCSGDSQMIIIQWGPEHSLQINFSANKTTNKFFVSALNLTVNASVFKDVNGTDGEMWSFVNQTSEFITPLNMSYKCSKVQDFNLKNPDPKLQAVLTMKDIQLEAYMNKTKPEFGAVQDCDSFDTPDIVPIAVGCALAILVVIVLVAYLIGRKRPQNRGYLSM